jgi:glutathione S-transferase
MITLYYAPGACSMASHITLEESGADYEARPVAMMQGEHKKPEYLAMNPRGKVPTLKVDNDVITENVAIQYFVAKSFPQANLAPKDLLGEARWISMNSWLSNSVHPLFTRIFRPGNFTEDEAGQPAVKESGKKAYWAALQEIDQILTGKQWILGSQFTTSDAYALVFYQWGGRIEMPLTELKNYTAWKDRMLQRPAVRKVLEREQSWLVKAA